MRMQDAFQSWQMIFPAIGFVVFTIVFIWLVVRVVRMKRRSLDHMKNLPLEEESSRPASDDRSK